MGIWVSALDSKEEKEFRALLKDMDELRNVKFPRSITPLDGQFGKPVYLVNLKWKREVGHVVYRMVKGKTQVVVPT
jgi:hypothetical protein